MFEPLRPGAGGALLLRGDGLQLRPHRQPAHLPLRRPPPPRPGGRGYAVRHVENITDVGHLTSDADEGEDKMERGARLQGKTAWEIAAFYTEAFQEDLRRLQILEPTVWCRATDHIPEMIDLIREIESPGLHLPHRDGIYFDTSLVPGLRAPGPARPLRPAGRGPHRAQRGEAPPPGLRPVEVLPAGRAAPDGVGQPLGARASRGGTSSARRCPPSTSASPSTCTPAASTTSRCTTPTRSPRPGRRRQAAGQLVAARRVPGDEATAR